MHGVLILHNYYSCNTEKANRKWLLDIEYKMYLKGCDGLKMVLLIQ